MKQRAARRPKIARQVHKTPIVTLLQTSHMWPRGFLLVVNRIYPEKKRQSLMISSQSGGTPADSCSKSVEIVQHPPTPTPSRIYPPCQDIFRQVLFVTFFIIFTTPFFFGSGLVMALPLKIQVVKKVMIRRQSKIEKDPGLIKTEKE